MPKVQINGTTIHYDRQGDGEPLILIPFLTADHACFAFQLPAYAEHFSCYAIDLRGSGASERGNVKCTMLQFVEDVASFIESVGCEKVHILGYSLGGAVAMSFAAKYPNKYCHCRFIARGQSQTHFCRPLSQVGKLLPGHSMMFAKPPFKQFSHGVSHLSVTPPVSTLSRA